MKNILATILFIFIVCLQSQGLTAGNARSQSAALIALDQMDGGTLEAHDVATLLSSRDATLKETADWIVDRHREWAAALVPHFREQIQRAQSLSPKKLEELQARLLSSEERRQRR